MSESLQIPANWQWSTMGEIAEIVGGGTPKTDRAEYFGVGIPWITPADLSGYTEKFISHGARSITKDGLENSSAQLIPAGTVLFSSRAPIGYVAIAANPVATNQGFKSFILNDGIDHSYVYYYLQHAKHLAVGLASGTTFLELSGKKAAQLPIPIAPLDEQRRIVAEIEKQFTRLDVGMAALRRVQTNLASYRLSVVKAACEGRLVQNEDNLATLDGSVYESAAQLLTRTLTERRRNWAGRGKYKEAIAPDTTKLSILPVGWIWASIDQIATIDLGKMLDTSKNQMGQQLFYLRNVNVRWRYVDTQDLRQMYFEDDEIERFGVKSGDLLVCEGGEPGRAAIWDGTVLGMMYQKALHRVRFYSSFQPLYLLSYLEYFAKTGRLEHRLTGSMIKHFTREAFLSLPVPIPSLVEQTRIVTEVERRLSILQDMEAALSDNILRTNRLRLAILQQAFQGNLVPQYLSEGTANRLLESIRENRSKAPPVQRKPRRSNIKAMRRTPVKTLTEMLERLDAIGGFAAPERLLIEANLGDDVESFFDLLREGRDLGLLIVPTGETEIIRRNSHAN